MLQQSGEFRVGLIGRQSETQTGVENHSLRAKVETLTVLVREVLTEHHDRKGEPCACAWCAKAHGTLAAASQLDILMGRRA